MNRALLLACGLGVMALLTIMNVGCRSARSSAVTEKPGPGTVSEQVLIDITADLLPSSSFDEGEDPSQGSSYYNEYAVHVDPNDRLKISLHSDAFAPVIIAVLPDRDNTYIYCVGQDSASAVKEITVTDCSGNLKIRAANLGFSKDSKDYKFGSYRLKIVKQIGK